MHLSARYSDNCGTVYFLKSSITIPSVVAAVGTFGDLNGSGEQSGDKNDEAVDDVGEAKSYERRSESEMSLAVNIVSDVIRFHTFITLHNTSSFLAFESPL